MRPSSKSIKALVFGFAVLALVATWISFQFGTHGPKGILRAVANAKRFLSEASTSANAPQRSANAPAGPQHSVNLSWKASTSPVVGYNVYRRGPSGVVNLNAEPITATTYVDRKVQPGQTYFYVTKAMGARGRESAASNEVRADIPSP